MRKNSIITIIIVAVFTLFFIGYIYPSFFNEKLEDLNVQRRFKEVEFQLGLDLQGGAHLLYQADLTGVPDNEVSDRMTALRDLVERRVDNFGIGEPLVQVKGDRLVVELPGVEDQEEAINQIGETPFLEFKIEISDEKKEQITQKIEEIEDHLGKEFEEIDLAEDFERLQEVENWELIFQDQFESIGLTGRFLRDAHVNIHQVTGQPAVSLTFDSEGAEILQEITRDNIGKAIATYLDQEIIQIAVIQEEISGGQAQISGNLTMEESRNLVRDLKIGALPVPISLISQQSIGPALGQESLSRSITAGIIGLLAVIAFMVIYYRMFGLLASVSLLIYIILVLTVFKLISVTLTLSGIAGFILSVGMAIDANILIFSRIREELSENKNFEKAVSEGFARAWPSIRDGNITTVLVASILFLVSTSFVQGFATVLIIGILISIFNAMVVTRSLILFFSGTKLSEIKKLWL